MNRTMGIAIGAFIAILGIVALVEVFAPERSDHMLGLATPVLAMLGLLLRSEYLAIKKERDDEAKLEAQTAELKQTVQEKGTEVKKALTVSNEHRDEMLDSMTTKLETIEKQTNGNLEKQFEDQKEHITAAATKAAETVIKAIPKVVEEALPKVVEEKVLPVLQQSPNKS